MRELSCRLYLPTEMRTIPEKSLYGALPSVCVDERRFLSEHSKRVEAGVRGTNDTPHRDQHDKPHLLEHVWRLQNQDLSSPSPSER